ncbi:glycosyltransferase [Leeia sp.]|uniref:MraY family glycosyltransferase n=1 Tax=Leeia sp. TaxID=2884678 RepID=UPI0035B2ABF5
MQILILAFLVSLLCTLGIIRYAHLHEHLTADHDLDGVQKFHDAPVPRVGGLSLALGLLAAGALVWLQKRSGSFFLVLLVAVPAFAGGLVEDLTKRVGPLARLLLTMLAAGCGFYVLGAGLARLDIGWLDAVLRWGPLSLLVTLVAVAGVANAVNIIDGYNGLAGVVTLVMFCALAYVARQVGDDQIWNICLALVGALLGFLVWNYPRGHIFLGDGGAYLLGFLLAELSVLLVVRHPQVSAWFPLLLVIYPIVETLFSIYRRVVLRGRSPGMPDAAHLHQLVYKRLVRWVLNRSHPDFRLTRNAMTSPYLWMLSSLGVIPAVLFWQHTRVLQAFAVLFIVSYVWLYRSIVRFRSPRWLRRRSS